MAEDLDMNAVCRRFYSTFTANTLKGGSWRGWRLKNRQKNNSHCKICRWTCATSL